MIFVYIIKSLKDEGYYVGICKDISARIKKHNLGNVRSTKLRIPFKLIYTEEYSDYKSARAREKEIKSWHGGNSFKELIAGAARSSNGRTTDSGSVYLGSNPSLAAAVRRN